VRYPAEFGLPSEPKLVSADQVRLRRAAIS